ncbi:MAG: hypothetical protein KBF90_02115 [Coprothermobacter sp.]|nr:hypothetical protein [Coprothermobacter sp.]
MVSEGLAFGEIVIQGKSYRDDVFLGYGEPQPWQRIEPHQVVLEDVQELILKQGADNPPPLWR